MKHLVDPAGKYHLVRERSGPPVCGAHRAENQELPGCVSDPMLAVTSGETEAQREGGLLRVS